MDGYRRETMGNPSARVCAAIGGAYPMPTTITAAAAEYAMWERRDHELGLVLEDTSDSQLDLPAYMRRDVVQRLLETGFRATSLAEVLIRQRHAVDAEMAEPEIEQAVLLDLEALVAAGASVAPEPHQGQRSRRARGFEQLNIFNPAAL